MNFLGRYDLIRDSSEHFPHFLIGHELGAEIDTELQISCVHVIYNVRQGYKYASDDSTYNSSL